MSNASSRLRQFASAVRPYLSRRYLRRWLALAAAIVVVWLVWPFVPLIGHASAVRALIQLGPGLAGIDRPKTYLILVENEDELRATGGYITAAGTVTVHYGRITNLAIEDVFAIDNLQLPYPRPPQPLQDYMDAPIWLLRDANWSPDFPSSAGLAEALYTTTRSKTIDGVVALDQTSLRIMLQAIGPISVEGVGTRIDANNLVSLLRTAREPPPGQTVSYDWWLHRKDFMPTVAQAMLHRVVWANWGNLLYAALSALDERHVQMTLKDGAAEQILEEHGWNGRLEPGQADYLMLVESNVGFNKVNADEQSRLGYAVDLTASTGPQATVTLMQTNPAAGELPCKPGPNYGSGRYADLIDRCYWSYVRFYTPSGAVLQAATPHDIPANWMLLGKPVTGTITLARGENGTQSFGTLVVVPFSTTLTTTVQYQLAPGVLTVANGQTTYTLRLQKQAGTAALPVALSVRLPAGAAIRSAPRGGQQQGDTWQLELALQESTTIQLTYSNP
jgi:Protein of unknown function (DUF4012)